MRKSSITLGKGLFVLQLAAAAMFSSGHAMAEQGTVQTTGPGLAAPASPIVAPTSTSDSDFKTSVGDSSAGN